MITRKIALYLLVFAAVNVSAANPNDFPWSTKPLKSHLKQVEKERGWECFGAGTSHMRGAPAVELFFWAPQTPTLQEARRLYVVETQKAINQYRLSQKKSKKQSPTPFSIRNLGYVLVFFNVKNNPNHFIAKVSNQQDIIFYKTYNPETDKYETIHKETYEEALRIVEEESLCHQL